MWCVGAENTRTEHPAHQSSHLLSHMLNNRLLTVFEKDIDDAAKGRKKKELTLLHLLVEEPHIIVSHHMADDGRIRITRLQDDKALLAATTRTARHLLHQLISTLMTAEVGLIKHGVGIENAHQSSPLVTIWVPTRISVLPC